MKIAILHNAVTDSDSAADRDVLLQVEAVEQALSALGHESRRIACTLNLQSAADSLTATLPAIVFNLVESLGGSDRLAHLASALLDDLDLPYTGTRSAMLHLTNNKPAAKQRLREADLPTPDWVTASTLGETGRPPSLPPPYIVKAVWEHASLGLDDRAIIRASIRGSNEWATIREIEFRAERVGRPCFAEQFIDGREFNLSLLAGDDAPRVLPPAEIDFSSFPKHKAKIVGWAAKWDSRAFEFVHTPRKFEFLADDAPLLERLSGLALDCWRVFELRGYARVDFRVDCLGRPWILEINANPCLSPDAGFAAALAQASVPLVRAVQCILDDALKDPTRGRSDSRTSSALAATLAAPRADTLAIARPFVATLRTEVRPSDEPAVRRIVESTGLFRPGEIDVAVELVQARLDKGAESGYEFVFAEQQGQTVAYACFGRNTMTVQSWDLYWIAVEKDLQGTGLGRALLNHVQQHVAAAGGGRIYIETSHRADYQATRGFYERCGYQLEAVLEDFYAPGDSKAIYVGQVARLA